MKNKELVWRFGCNLRYLRLEHDMTILQLSTQINVSNAALSRYERGEMFPGKDKIAKVSDFFKTDPYDLFYKDLSKNKKIEPVRHKTKKGRPKNTMINCCKSCFWWDSYTRSCDYYLKTGDHMDYHDGVCSKRI